VWVCGEVGGGGVGPGIGYPGTDVFMECIPCEEDIWVSRGRERGVGRRFMAGEVGAGDAVGLIMEEGGEAVEAVPGG
jgi:hypothetical protein